MNDDEYLNAGLKEQPLASKESSLRESEAQFRLIFESSPEAILIGAAPPVGRIALANPAACRIFGYSAEEFQRLSQDALIDPADPRLKTALAARDASGYFQGELNCLRKDGSKFSAEATWLLQRDARAALIISDLTACKQTESQLRKLTRVVEQSSANIIITDRSGKIEYANPAFLSSSGYSLQEVQGMNPRILKSGYTLQSEYSQLWNTILSGQIWRGEFHNRKKNGELYWESASISPLRDSSGEITSFVAVKEDITAQKYNQQQIVEALEFNRTIIHNVPVGIMIFKENGECISVNPAAEKITGAAQSIHLDTNYNDLEIWKRTGLLDAARQAIRSGNPVEMEIHDRNHSGAEIWLKNTLIPFSASEGTHLMVILEDEADHHKAQAESQLVNEKLRALVQELEQSKQRADLLRQISELLQACKTVNEAYRVFFRFSSQLFKDTCGALYTVSEDQKSVQNVIAWGSGLASEEYFKMTDCWGLRLGRANLVQSGQDHLKCRHMERSFNGPYLDIPLVSFGEVIGLLHIEWQAETRVSPDTQDLAQILADNFSLSLSNINLRHDLELRSIRDPLTGVYNLQYVQESLTRELTRAERKHSMIGLILVSIDRFETYNQVHGKAVGDLVLARLGELMISMVRSGDIVGRTASDEFVLILPEITSEIITVHRAETIRQTVEKLGFDNLGESLPVTVSIGVAVYPADGTNWDYLKAKADKVISKARRDGGNRVEIIMD